MIHELASYADREGDQPVVEALMRAAADRDRLGRLVASGRVLRDRTVGANVPGAAAFAADVQRRAFPSRTRGLDTIRPNPKNRKGKRR